VNERHLKNGASFYNHPVHTGGVTGSIPVAPTNSDRKLIPFRGRFEAV
jgi:hypothetical protein